MWAGGCCRRLLQKAAVSFATVPEGLFTLEGRPGVVLCPLLARVSSLQGAAVCLPNCACLLLGPGTLKLHGVTFQGVNRVAGCWL